MDNSVTSPQPALDGTPACLKKILASMMLLDLGDLNLQALLKLVVNDELNKLRHCSGRKVDVIRTSKQDGGVDTNVGEPTSRPKAT